MILLFLLGARCHYHHDIIGAQWGNLMIPLYDIMVFLFLGGFFPCRGPTPTTTTTTTAGRSSGSSSRRHQRQLVGACKSFCLLMGGRGGGRKGAGGGWD